MSPYATEDAALGTPIDHTGLRVMPLAECLERLDHAPIGRLAFSRQGEIIVLPVHHVLRGSHICFRTSGGSKIEAAADHDPVGFEVDAFDPDTHTGWSVTVSGTASVVGDDAVVAELVALDRNPWHVGESEVDVWVEIRCDEIAGREILSRTDGEVSPDSTDDGPGGQP